MSATSPWRVAWGRLRGLRHRGRRSAGRSPPPAETYLARPCAGGARRSGPCAAVRPARTMSSYTRATVVVVASDHPSDQFCGRVTLVPHASLVEPPALVEGLDLVVVAVTPMTSPATLSDLLAPLVAPLLQHVQVIVASVHPWTFARHRAVPGSGCCGAALSRCLRPTGRTLPRAAAARGGLSRLLAGGHRVRLIAPTPPCAVPDPSRGVVPDAHPEAPQCHLLPRRSVGTGSQLEQGARREAPGAKAATLACYPTHPTTGAAAGCNHEDESRLVALRPPVTLRRPGCTASSVALV